MLGGGFYRRPGMIAIALGAAMAAAGSLFGGQSRVDPRTVTFSNAPVGPGPGGRGRNARSKAAPFSYHSSRSMYLPHQGARECLRRRMGGNATRIRMERAGFVWDDRTGTGDGAYVPVSTR